MERSQKTPKAAIQRGRWRERGPGDTLAGLKQRQDKLALRLYSWKGRSSWLNQQCVALLKLHGFRLSLLLAFGLCSTECNGYNFLRPEKRPFNFLSWNVLHPWRICYTQPLLPPCFGPSTTTTVGSSSTLFTVDGCGWSSSRAGGSHRLRYGPGFLMLRFHSDLHSPRLWMILS